MRDRGFLVEESKTARDLVQKHIGQPLVTIGSGELVGHAVAKMKKFDISQIPVIKDNAFAGSIDEGKLFQVITEQPNAMEIKIEAVMGTAFPIVSESTTIEHVSKLLTKETPAVLVKLENGKHHIITKYDVIEAIG
jgi:cystathionine beta-synthase